MPHFFSVDARKIIIMNWNIAAKRGTAIPTKKAQNMSKAARMASVDRTTLYRLIERYNPAHDWSADTHVPAER